jgi:thymidylate synthase (FAD)
MKLLDHGYLDYVEHWGSDESIVRAARMSTAKGFLGWGPTYSCPIHEGHSGFACCEAAIRKEGDEKLLRYLWENQHTGPFEFCGLTVEVKAPIMVFREWHRHRTQSFNEMSARYVPLPDENYVPTVERIIEGSKKTANKQASSVAGECSEANAMVWLTKLNLLYEQAETVYQAGLRYGVPKELARLPVPVGRYSRMRATANLWNWLRFLKLRMAPTAQYEIRVYADAVGQLLSEHFPRTMELFNGPR